MKRTRRPGLTRTSGDAFHGPLVLPTDGFERARRTRHSPGDRPARASCFLGPGEEPLDGRAARAPRGGFGSSESRQAKASPVVSSLTDSSCLDPFWDGGLVTAQGVEPFLGGGRHGGPEPRLGGESEGPRVHPRCWGCANGRRERRDPPRWAGAMVATLPFRKGSTTLCRSGSSSSLVTTSCR